MKIKIDNVVKNWNSTFCTKCHNIFDFPTIEKIFYRYCVNCGQDKRIIEIN